MIRKSSSLGSPARSPNKPKLRRKVTIESALKGENVSAVQRLVEYFVVVSSVPRWKESETIGSPGVSSPSPRRRLRRKRPASSPREEQQRPEKVDSENIRMPQHAEEHSFQPKITARFPETDYPDNPLNPMITHFCYPHSDSIVPSQAYIMPRIHHFVLTNEKGCKVYGTCLTVYEDYFPGAKDPYRRRHTVIESTKGIEVSMEGDGKALYVPRVLCILSTWPYLIAFREYLTQLYRLATTTNLMETPLERYILNLCLEIPAPPPGAFEVNVSIFNSPIKFWAPPAKLPVAYVALPFETLFDCLDLNSILVVWYALLMEQKILLVSSQYSILTVCAETFCALLFPLQWSHLYIPLLPRFLSPMLDAPVPYLVGCIRENWEHAEENLSPETIVVDLDTNEVFFGKKSPRLASPPLKKWEKLKTALAEAVGDVYWRVRGLEVEYRQWQKGKISQKELFKAEAKKNNIGWKEKLHAYDDAFNMAYAPDSPNADLNGGDKVEQSQWELAQEAFLRFFVATFKSYRKFLHIPESEPDVPIQGERPIWTNRRTFDRDGYVAWQKPEHQSFYRSLCLTQQFDDFVTKRMYSPGEPDCIFFDQHIDAKLNRSKLRVKKVDTPFLVHAKTHKVLKAFESVQPNRDGLPEGRRSYRYDSWPDHFDKSFFCNARRIPSMITAEFDRQAALVARLRTTGEDNANDDVFAEFFGADYDPNPEVATFTVFFFVYGAVIGLDWQEFEKRCFYGEIMMTGSSGSIPYAGSFDRSVAFTEPESDLGKNGSRSPNNWENLTNEKNAGAFMVSVPDCNFKYCDVCPSKGQKRHEFMAQWVAGAIPSPVANREKSLFDSDMSLAEYEEARAVATAQLDLAFEVLQTMSIRRLATDADAFRSLMEACGRCGSTDRAIQLIQIMKRDGFVADREIYSYFVAAFAVEDGMGQKDHDFQDTASHDRRGSDAYSTYLRKKFDESRDDGTDCSTEGFEVDSVSASSSTTSSRVSPSLLTEVYNAVFSVETKKTKKKKKGLKSKRRRAVVSPTRKAQFPVTDRVLKQVVLGEKLLEYLYPDLRIDTTNNSCPKCSNVLAEDDCVRGWKSCEFRNYQTQCPVCKHRFVPHFSVSCSSDLFEGSQGTGTPLYCEFLSPWVLRMELARMVKRSINGVQGIQDPQWRSGTDIQAVLWWNMVVAFNRYRLPVSFLLQGSFQNRLINPTPDS